MDMNVKDMDIEQKKAAYLNLTHAMQSGVAMEMNYDREPTEPKHLRVALNTVLCQNAALVRLLMEKGIITEDEYWTQMLIAIIEEVDRYEASLRELIGGSITLR